MIRIPRSRGAVLAGALLLSNAAASAASGQQVEEVVTRFVRAWGSEDTSALERLLAPSVRLDLEGQQYLGVPPRQVAATVARVFGRYAPHRPRPTRQGVLAESPDRGYAEFTWSPVAEDTGRPVSHVVFASLRRSDGEWRISELRILR